MKSKTLLLPITLLIGLIFLFNAAVSSSTDWDKSYTAVFTQPVAVPGQVLPAGVYVFKLVDDDTNSHIVQVWNAEQTKIIATMLSTIAMVMEKAPAENLLVFENRGKDQPRAVKVWFHPGSSYGEVFTYSAKK